jgi:hypothetical protein
VLSSVAEFSRATDVVGVYRMSDELQRFASTECTCFPLGGDCDRCKFLDRYGDRWIDENGYIGVALLVAERERLRDGPLP